ncbi:MAG: phenylalanine--tRNA ligase subunit beta [Rhodospirillaceae bacterium]|jgi:phenylalanyl-tRNA synthetase beta chain|nr:phenylalanine--tRNA ligase subunit beta [Rhodospirillaceae bacterium]MBT6305315.1 phenylalanine--tRNA ligase subunit beta [Rhodospirillaceae bacterium]MDC1441089.1 phenylalanine--tRNA ligase subunit beta [Rhodospirillaceae bacterium]
MKFTLSWLKDHLETKASLDQICDKLPMLGLEVESVQNRSIELSEFIVGYVVEAYQHPNADRLRVCIVDTGSEKIQVVCGAPNARTGIKGVFAPAGARIPATGDELKKGVIRGEESNGMLCSEREMGISDEHDGIIELPEDSKVGEGYAKVAGLDDPIIDIAITPDRADCLGVRGIARDLAAAGLGELKPLDVSPVKTSFKSPINWRVDLPEMDPPLAPLVVGRYFRGVKNQPSPKWLKERLQAVDLRPISALVDITNYVMMDVGRPLHAYDADKVEGDIFIRLAKDGEKYKALDGKEYSFDSDMIVIGDDEGVDDLAGIMGGERSGCSNETVNMFLEAAIFDPIRTATTGRKLNIISDARYRFERGLDATSPFWGSEMAARLVLDVCGGEASELVIYGEEPEWGKIFTLRHSRIEGLTGVKVPEPDCVRILETLGFEVSGAGEKIECVVPPWRSDVIGEADLVEEIIRVWGFDEIPMVSMINQDVIPQPALSLRQIREGIAKRSLAVRGMAEAVTYSFLSSRDAVLFGGGADDLRLNNPISADLDVMRPSVLPNLISAVGRNSNIGSTDLAIFEVGPQYADATPDGQQMVAGAIRSGKTSARDWTKSSRPVDLFDIKADALFVLKSLGAPINNLQVDPAGTPSWYHPGRSGAFRLGPKILGYFGDIHPKVLSVMDVEGPVVGFEVFMESIPASRSKGPSRSLLKLDALQPVNRDFAFIVDQELPAEKLIKAAQGADKSLVSAVQLFDEYIGQGIPEGKKSLAIAVTLQPKTQTFTDEELESVSEKIISKIAKDIGGHLRV